MIVKHTGAFLAVLGWIIMGIAFLLVVVGSDTLTALGGLLFVTGGAVFLLTLIVLAVRSICAKDKPKPATGPEYEAAVDYMENSRFNLWYWAVIVLLTPVLPLLLIYVIDKYFVGVVVINLGIMAWLLIVKKDLMAKSFCTVKRAGRFFYMQDGCDNTTAEGLYGDYTVVFPAESWSGDMTDVIYNLLLRENALTGDVKCYMLRASFLREKYGYDYKGIPESLIAVPLSQFRLDEHNGRKVISQLGRLSKGRLSDIINHKYYTCRSFSEADYAFSGEGDMLKPALHSQVSVMKNGQDIMVRFDRAYQGDSRVQQYFGCLLRISNAQIIADDSRLYETGDIGYAESLEISDDMPGELELWILSEEYFEDSDQEDYEDYEDEQASLDSCRIKLSLTCDDIRWHWNGYRNAEKEHSLRINTGYSILM